MAIQANPAACASNPATISRRSPNRLIRAPAIGATTNKVAVHGSSRRPDVSGLICSPACRYWAKKNTAL